MRKGTANPRTTQRIAYYAKVNDITRRLLRQDEALCLLCTTDSMFRCRMYLTQYFESCCWFAEQGLLLEFSFIHGEILHDLTTESWKTINALNTHER